jgi:GTP pyrophosphokinase
MRSPNELFQDLMNKVQATDKNYDIEKISRAFNLANQAHDGQVRKSGEPYISHPIAVAEILLDLCMDTDTIVSALLHDVVEDTDITLEELSKQFGETVANLVDGVTKIGMIHLNTTGSEDGENNMQFTTEEERKAESIRKILVAMFKDVRVIIIKLADRLHNMRTLSTFRPDKQRRIALESMTFYAPLAHRLGIAHMKEEMEDRSLFYLDEFAYKEIEESLERHKSWRDDFIGKITARITERLSDMSPPPVIEGRIKGIYSLYKKMFSTAKNLDEIYDVYAVRVITNSTVDCYNVLGVIHDMYTPIPGSFKDYIATPKVNGYQSLHTTVLGREKQPFEVQVRTHDMHGTARYGVAAHWRYKLGLDSVKNQHETKFDFIRQLLDQQQQADDVDNLANAIKTDLSPDEVYAITPRGHPVSLPRGSTVVDFAYSIHTEVGNKMVGAKIHRKMVSFDYILKTGDVVEILTTNNKSQGPTRSWLDYARTSEAKAKIRHWLKHERRDENIASGSAYVESVLRRDGIKAERDLLTAIAQKHRFKTLEDFYAAIGYGGVTLANAASWIRDSVAKPEPSQPSVSIEEQIEKNLRRKQSAGIIVEGIEDCAVKFASCCNPLPGDEIIGFVTRGFGVSVHKEECSNIIARRLNEENRERLINVTWSESARDFYTATIEVIAVDRKGLLMDVITLVANSHILIVSSNARQLKNGNAVINFSVEISNLEQLRGLMTKLDKITGVISVERTGK